jgi:hypothetical protein
MLQNSTYTINNDLLKSEELTQLGKFYTNDLKLIIQQDENNIRIVQPPTPWIQLILMTVIIGSLGIWLLVFLHFNGNETYQKELYLRILSFSILALGIFGPIILFLMRYSYLRKISPLLEYNKSLKTINVHNGTFSTSIDNVFCLLALTLDKYEYYSELQLIIEIDGKKSRKLIHTSMSMATSFYGDLIKAFGVLTGIQTVIAESSLVSNLGPVEVLNSGTMKIRIITPKIKDSNS